ncbi:MAG TPA: MarR family transcriptional regulator [Candidatus Saccharimonadales bacterium]|nr:MarR family transcriptional regulator [Candidatus Saccharimonadales bacterium]
MNIPTYNAAILQTKAHRILRSYVYACLHEYGLNPSYWSLIGIVGEAPAGLRPAEVARRMGVKAPLITMMANELIARKLVKRVPHPHDGRAKLLILTKHGTLFVNQVERALTDHLQALFSGVTIKEMTAYHRVLLAIIANDAALQALAS